MFEHYAAGEKLYTSTVAPVCETYELTYMEFTILLFLANNPQYDTASQIVRYRHLTKSHVSISIRNLLERGLLHGAYGEKNRRTIHLTLTEAAAPIVTDGKAAQNRFYEILFEGFTQEERDQLMKTVDRVDQNISRYTQEPEVRAES